MDEQPNERKLVKQGTQTEVRPRTTVRVVIVGLVKDAGRLLGRLRRKKEGA
jgi:hypothetical protein